LPFAAETGFSPQRLADREVNLSICEPLSFALHWFMKQFLTASGEVYNPTLCVFFSTLLNKSPQFLVFAEPFPTDQRRHIDCLNNDDGQMKV
jgi:hypothetical protein